MANQVNYYIKIVGTNPLSVQAAIQYFQNAHCYSGYHRRGEKLPIMVANKVSSAYAKPVLREGFTPFFSAYIDGECDDSFKDSILAPRTMPDDGLHHFANMMEICKTLSVFFEGYCFDGANGWEEYKAIDATGNLVDSDYAAAAEAETKGFTVEAFNTKYRTSYTEKEIKNNEYLKVLGLEHIYTPRDKLSDRLWPNKPEDK